MRITIEVEIDVMTQYLQSSHNGMRDRAGLALVIEEYHENHPYNCADCKERRKTKKGREWFNDHICENKEYDSRRREFEVISMEP